jgi:hypothetical protein
MLYSTPPWSCVRGHKLSKQLRMCPPDQSDPRPFDKIARTRNYFISRCTLGTHLNICCPNAVYFGDASRRIRDRGTKMKTVRNCIPLHCCWSVDAVVHLWRPTGALAKLLRTPGVGCQLHKKNRSRRHKNGLFMSTWVWWVDNVTSMRVFFVTGSQLLFRQGISTCLLSLCHEIVPSTDLACSTCCSLFWYPRRLLHAHVYAFYDVVC